MKKVVKRPTSIPAKSLKDYLDTQKVESRLLGPLDRHLMAKVDDGSRRSDVLHPSEIVKSDWCHRASYHLLRGAEKPAETKRLRSETVFSTGHEVHAKYQRWLYEMGVLVGDYSCRACKHRWQDRSPLACPNCKGIACTYDEVQVISDRHRIHGKADGLVEGLGDPFVLEIKSIGPGTLRMEQPQLLADHDGDILKAWRDIKRPFLGHRRQVTLYAEILQVDDIVILYELKATNEVREFVIKRNPALIEDVLEAALDLDYAVRNERIPDCNVGGEKLCTKCKPFEEKA